MLLELAAIIAGFVVLAAGDQEARQSVTAANNAFALDLFEVLRGEPGNLVVSPLSAAAALALCYMGAGGNTAVQMRDALHLPESAQRISDGYRALVDSLQSSEEITIRMANKLYADRQFSVKPAFQQTAVDNFRSGAEQVDFRNAAEAARLAINRWVEEKTEEKIKDLLKEGQS